MGEEAELIGERFMTEVYIDELEGPHAAFDTTGLKYENADKQS